jgi:hypothetical protein
MYDEKTKQDFKRIFCEHTKKEQQARVVFAFADSCIDCGGLREFVEKLCEKYSIKLVKFELLASGLLMASFDPPSGYINVYSFTKDGDIANLYGATTGSRYGVYFSIMQSLGRDLTFKEKIVGFYYAMRDTLFALKSGRKVLAPKKIAKERLSTCLSCEHFNKEKMKTCDKCGCFVYAKTKLSDQSCPIGKWDRLTQ